MIKLSIIIPLTLTILFANELDEIDKMVSKINSKREGTLSKKEISSITSPMPKLIVIDNNSSEDNKTVVKVKESSFNLTAIVNNSAFINGKWYKVGDRVGTFKLVDIMDDSVYLKDGKRTKLIFFKQNNGKIKIRVGR